MIGVACIDQISAIDLMQALYDDFLDGFFVRDVPFEKMAKLVVGSDHFNYYDVLNTTFSFREAPIRSGFNLFSGQRVRMHLEDFPTFTNCSVVQQDGRYFVQVEFVQSGAYERQASTISEIFDSLILVATEDPTVSMLEISTKAKSAAVGRGLSLARICSNP
jgi:hypothetical protein